MKADFVTPIRRKRWLYTVVLVLVLGLVVWLVARGKEAEPVYQGKTVTQWIREYGKKTPSILRTNASVRVVRVQSVGTTNSTRIVSGIGAGGLPPGISFSTNLQGLVQLVTSSGTFTLGSSGFTPSPYFIQPSRPDPAAMAIQKIKAPAVPYLVRALQRQDGLVETWRKRIWEKAPQYVQTNYFSPPIPAVEMRRNASMLLYQMGSEARAAVPALTEALTDTDPEVRRNVAMALGSIGPAAREGIPALKQALNEAKGQAYLEIFTALDRLSTNTAGLETDIRKWTRSRVSEVDVMQLVRDRGLDGPATALLLAKLLEDLDVKLRAARERAASRGSSLYGTVYVGGGVGSVFPKTPVETRIELLRLLAPTGVHARFLVPELLELLNDEDIQTQCVTLRTLAAIGPGERVLPHLERRMYDGSLYVISEAKAAARSVRARQTNSLSILALTQGLGSPDPDIRLRVAGDLGESPSEARPAMGALAKALNDPETIVGLAAFVALDGVATNTVEMSEAMAGWRQIPGNQTNILRLITARDLCGPSAALALAKMLPGADGKVRRDILDRLERTGGDAQCALSQLLPLLENPEAETRYMTIRVLRAIGPSAVDALPALERLKTSDPSTLVATSAARTIAVINGEEMGGR